MGFLRKNGKQPRGNGMRDVVQWDKRGVRYAQTTPLFPVRCPAALWVGYLRSRTGRRGGQCGGAAHERQGRVHHQLHLPDGWRHYGQLFLWPAEAGDGGLTKKTGEHGCPPVLRF